VFYPVRPHVTTTAPLIPQPDFSSKVFIFTIDASEKSDIDRVEFLAQQIEKNGGKAICFISSSVPKEHQDALSSKFHSHVVDLKNSDEMQGWFEKAKSMGALELVIHVTGKVPQISKLIESSRSEWEDLIDKFINTPATIIQKSLEFFVPGGAKDPREFKGKTGTIMTIGPDLPSGKISGAERARVEVFRGAMRPFAATVNQELSDVLKSRVRSFLVLPGTVDGKEPDNERIFQAINFFTSDKAADSAEVIFCIDEVR